MSDTQIAGVLRDASSYRTHRHTSGCSETNVLIPAYHVTRDGGRTTACGRIGAEFTIETRLGEISDRRRCQRPGCRQGWVEWEEAQ